MVTTAERQKRKEAIKRLRATAARKRGVEKRAGERIAQQKQARLALGAGKLSAATKKAQLAKAFAGPRVTQGAKKFRKLSIENIIAAQGRAGEDQITPVATRQDIENLGLGALPGELTGQEKLLRLQGITGDQREPEEPLEPPVEGEEAIAEPLPTPEPEEIITPELFATIQEAGKRAKTDRLAREAAGRAPDPLTEEQKFKKSATFLKFEKDRNIRRKAVLRKRKSEFDRRAAGVTNAALRASIRQEVNRLSDAELKAFSARESDKEEILKAEFVDTTTAEAIKKTKEEAELERLEEREERIDTIQAEFAVKGEVVSRKKAESIDDQREKFDLKGEKEKELGAKVDAIWTTGGEEDAEKFEQTVTAADDLDDAYDAIKSRRGKAFADNAKKEYLEKKGWDEQSIEDDRLATELKGLFFGDIGGKEAFGSINKIVKDWKASGTPDTFIAAQMEVLAESPDADPITQAFAKIHAEDLRPEEKFDVRGGVESGFVQITRDPATGKAIISPVGRAATDITGGGSITSGLAQPRDPSAGFSSLTEEYNANAARDPKGAAQVDAIVNSTTLRKLENISNSKASGFLRDRVGILLGMKQQELLEKGDFVGFLRASTGGGGISSTEREKINKAKTVVGQLKALSSQLSNKKTKSINDFGSASKNKFVGERGTFDISPLTGWLAQKNPWNEKAQTINGILTAIVPNLARGIYGEVGVLTDTDVKLYQKTIPNLRQTDAVKKAVMAMTLLVVRDAIRNQLETAAEAGLNVSGFVRTYEKLNVSIQAIEDELGIVREPEEIVAGTSLEGAATPTALTAAPAVTEPTAPEAPTTQFTRTDLTNAGIGEDSITEISGLSPEEQAKFGQAFNSEQDKLIQALKLGKPITEILTFF